MKKFLTGILACSILAGLTACGNDQEPSEGGNRRDPNQEDGKFYNVAVLLGGDFVDESDEPFTREGEDNTVVGINVTRHAAGSPNETQYACGAFTDISNINISLESGYVYSFAATIIVDGTDKYFRFYEPLRYIVSGNPNTEFDLHTSEVNKFLYAKDGSAKMFHMLHSGAVYVNMGNRNLKYVCFPRLDRYYGSITSYDPDSNSRSGVNIEMRYKCFGLKFVVNKIPENSYLTCRDVTNTTNPDRLNNLYFPDDLKLDSNNNTNNPWTCVYSLYNLTSADPQKLTLEFTLHENGGTATKTFTTETTVSANRTRVLNIDLSGGGSGSNGNVGFKMESKSLDIQDPQTVTK